MQKDPASAAARAGSGKRGETGVQYYFAPLEGVTGAVFRRVHSACFPGIDKYFMPFVSPGRERVFSKRDMRELSPAFHEGIPAVPQLLTRQAEDFLWAAELLADLGYREVNLNLGCPSGTVTAKGKGSGLLRDREELERFLEEIFRRAPLAVSIKTRVGFQSPEEFEGLLDVFQRVPYSELIIHPRVRADFYRGGARMEAFARAVERGAAPLCYNGDLTTAEEVEALSRRFPTVDRVMIGRGLVGDPALVVKARGGAPAGREELRRFHDALYDGYTEAFGSRYNAMLRMKELWFYLIDLFDGGDGCLKALKKARDTGEYEGQVEAIFQSLPLRRDSAARWREQSIL
ncbi:MAG TPA: tRNA-dihydrouridine synthase family protein [Candidatus Intestinimonas stercorigallinarum]|nr:tRNA-dihydrouridine synthase family protein [Candidatus Intestinimonas stercorigallinarum]